MKLVIDINKCLHKRTLIIKGCEYCAECRQPSGQLLLPIIRDVDNVGNKSVDKLFAGLMGTFSTGYEQDANKNLPTGHIDQPGKCL